MYSFVLSVSPQIVHDYLHLPVLLPCQFSARPRNFWKCFPATPSNSLYWVVLSHSGGTTAITSEPVCVKFLLSQPGPAPGCTPNLLVRHLPLQWTPRSSAGPMTLPVLLSQDCPPGIPGANVSGRFKWPYGPNGGPIGYLPSPPTLLDFPDIINDLPHHPPARLFPSISLLPEI